MKSAIAPTLRVVATTALVASLLVAVTGTALAGKPHTGSITVAGPVAHGETTTATVNPGGSQTYVLVKCYAPDLDGAYVYARFFGVDSDNTAVIGPLASSLWTSGAGTCVAEEGTFRKNGRWVVAASTTFDVLP